MSDAAANTVSDPLTGGAVVEVVVGATGALVVGVVLEPPLVERTVVVVTPIAEVDGVVVELVDGTLVVVVEDEVVCFLA